MTVKKTTKKKAPVMNNELLTHNMFVLKDMVETLNIAIAAVAYAAKVKPTALDKVEAEEFMNWVQDTLHPLVRRADELHKGWVEIVSKNAKEAVNAEEGEK